MTFWANTLGHFHISGSSGILYKWKLEVCFLYWLEMLPCAQMLLQEYTPTEILHSMSSQCISTVRTRGCLPNFLHAHGPVKNDIFFHATSTRTYVASTPDTFVRKLFQTRSVTWCLVSPRLATKNTVVNAAALAPLSSLLCIPLIPRATSVLRTGWYVRTTYVRVRRYVQVKRISFNIVTPVIQYKAYW